MSQTNPLQPEGFYLDHDVISKEVWNKLEYWLETNRIPIDEENKEEQQQRHEMIPWQIESVNQNRPVAQYGFKYDYHKDVVDTTSTTPPIPHFLKELLVGQDDYNSVLLQQSKSTTAKPASTQTTATAVDDEFTQCIINDYRESNIVIPWHKDDLEFGPVIIVYTFGDNRPLDFRCPRRHHHNSSGSHGNEYSSSSASTTTATTKNDYEDEYIYFTAYPRHCSRYILSGSARYMWEHSVPSGNGRRVSFTFRTLRNNNETTER